MARAENVLLDPDMRSVNSADIMSPCKQEISVSVPTSIDKESTRTCSMGACGKKVGLCEPDRDIVWDCDDEPLPVELPVCDMLLVCEAVAELDGVTS